MAKDMLSEELKTAYDEFYTTNGIPWRMLDAKYYRSM